jgi:hypothetical protein
MRGIVRLDWLFVVTPGSVLLDPIAEFVGDDPIGITQQDLATIGKMIP